MQRWEAAQSGLPCMQLLITTHLHIIATSLTSSSHSLQDAKSRVWRCLYVLEAPCCCWQLPATITSGHSLHNP